MKKIQSSHREESFAAGTASGTASGTLSVQKQELPYERFLSCGAQSLTNAELLAIILRTGTREKNATELSREILGFHEPGSVDLSALHDLTLEDLLSIPGIGEVRAVKILSLAEISRRLVREAASTRLVFTSPSAVADYYMEELRHRDTETAILILLDNRMGFLGEEVLSHGSVNCTLMSPREIFVSALRWKAVNIMLLHNHPSGDPSPSEMDLQITERVCRAGRLLGIHLVDHLIIGDLCYTSLREDGYVSFDSFCSGSGPD
ncbi:MAG: DNA repair protein RadC [Eubacteriales bacterium]|nr:DNA repair protein RadC [Eubacteriales bacterium]